MVDNGHTEEAIDTANSIPNDFYKFLALNHLYHFMIKSTLQDYNEGKLVNIDEKDIAILLNPNNYKYSPIKNLGEIEGTSLTNELNKNQ